jgi:hypothetical protein
MHVRRIVASAVAVGSFALAGTAVADQHQRETSIHSVRRDPHGQVSGVILNDGTELVGAANDQALKKVAVPGDPVRVTVDADDRMVLVNGRTFDTATIGDHDGAVLKPLVANPLGIGGGPVATDPDNARIDDATTLGRFFVIARVTMVLKTNVGVPSGLLMSDGSQIHVVPRFAGALSGIEPGMQLTVEGMGTRDESGVAMWALSIKQRDYVYLDVERGEGAPEINLTGPFATMP